MVWPKFTCFVRDMIRPSGCVKVSTYFYQRCLLRKRTFSQGRKDADLNNDRSMRSWCIHSYGSNDFLELQNTPSPRLRSATDVVVRVHAASVNPVDLRMREGYGAALLNTWRCIEGVQEFPLVFGRDFSGVVVKTGRLARRFRPGDEVWGTPGVIHGGTHTEYLVIKQDEISLKPHNLSHVEAASVPYVACTSWVALMSRAGITPHNAQGKRILVLGGSGGIGTFAIQLLKAFGSHVTSTCSTDAVELVTSLGADHVLDYTAADFQHNLESCEGFHIILDLFGDNTDAMLAKLLHRMRGTKYISLAPPLLANTDSLGMGLGLLAAAQSLVFSTVQKALCSRSSLAWAFFTPNPGALDHVRSLIESEKVRPVVQAVYQFEQYREAFEHLEAGHARGKTVIQVVQDQSK